MKAYREKQSASSQSMFSASLPLRSVLSLAILTVLYPALSYANPDGAQFDPTQVSINTSIPGVTTITNSPNAIIQWQNFSIAQNELTKFIQENGQSAVLNRIIGQNPSEILGQLTSNGKVFLINPNGIVFGAGAVIDTQGLIASSLALSDQDFQNGNYHFIAGPTAGNIRNEGINNEGIIRAGNNGSIILIAPHIENNGIIKSDGGSITLAAGHELTITNLDNPDIRFQIQAPDDSVLNLGKLLSEGGAINVFANTITHSGEINADSVQVDKQGHIQLVAGQDITLTTGSKISANNSQGDAGTIHIDSKTGTTLAFGTIEAQATQTGRGGKIELLGEHVGVLDQAKIDASGENGGGQVLIGGDYQGKNTDVHNAKATYIGQDTIIKADAKTTGDGGKVIVWSDNSTRAYGDISAKGGSSSGNGGFIETSGHWLDTAGIRINASALNGIGGEWLLDPYNITIQNTAYSNGSWNSGSPNLFTPTGTSIADVATIQSSLNAGTSVTISTTGAGTDLGNITVAANISKTSGGDATLQLWADNNIIINNSISSSFNKLNLVFKANNNGTGSQGNIDISSTAVINSNGGNLELNTTGLITNYGSLSAANISLKAGKMALDSIGTINGTSSVSLLTTNAISLGSSVDTTANTLELSNAELNTITAPILRIGDASSGAIDIKSALSLTKISSALNLTSGGAITQQAGATISVPALSLTGTSVTLKEANPVGVISGKATAGDFKYYSANQLTVSTVDGVSGITVPFANNIGLKSNVGINQQTGANLIGGSLGLKSLGSVWLNNSGNNISTIAADLSMGGLGTGTFGFFSNSNLTVGSVLSPDGVVKIEGITTNNQKIDITANALSINNAINAGTQSVDLKTDTLTWDAAGNGRVIGSEVGINNLTTGRPITVGGACIGGSGTCLSITELWRISAPVIGIGYQNGSINGNSVGTLTSGDIYVAGITSGSSTLSDRNAVTTRIGLLSGGGITQSATAINVQDLGIVANGAVTLSAANNITNLAAKTQGSNLTFNNGQGFKVIQMTGGTGYDSKSNSTDYYNINGINTCSASGSCGNVNLTAGNNGILTINAPLSANSIALTGGFLAGSYADLYQQYFNGGTSGGNTLPALTQTTTAGVLGTTQSVNPLADNSSSSDSTGWPSSSTVKEDKKTNKQCTK